VDHSKAALKKELAKIEKEKEMSVFVPDEKRIESSYEWEKMKILKHDRHDGDEEREIINKAVEREDRKAAAEKDRVEDQKKEEKENRKEVREAVKDGLMGKIESIHSEDDKKAIADAVQEGVAADLANTHSASKLKDELDQKKKKEEKELEDAAANDKKKE